jgi:DNA-binding transcriptional MerR regulator
MRSPASKPPSKPLSKPLRTSQIAKAIGVHPNTVRIYEEWGYLPPVPRSARGYRLFTQAHLEQMRLARLALTWPYPGKKAVLEEMIKSAAGDDLGMAMELAYQCLVHVRTERTYAEAAVEFLERWASGQGVDTTKRQLQIGEAAERLGVSADTLRSWERDGMLEVPRAAHSGYRLYSAAELGRLRVIRMLVQAGYSRMAILRMLIQFDAGKRENLGQALDTPRPDEDILMAADRWLSTLEELETRARAMIGQIGRMIKLSQSLQ